MSISRLCSRLPTSFSCLFSSGLDHKFNTWIPRDDLLEKGFAKLVQRFDDLEASREGAGQRDTNAHTVRKHLEDIGLDGDIAQYNEIAGLSGGRYFDGRRGTGRS